MAQSLQREIGDRNYREALRVARRLSGMSLEEPASRAQLATRLAQTDARLADFIAEWSKDPSTKVGAVVTHTKSRRIVSTGFNGFPAGVEDALALARRGRVVAHLERGAFVLVFGSHEVLP